MMRPNPCSTMCGRSASGKPHTAHHIGLEETQPVGVGNFEERLRLEDAEIVDEDVDGPEFG